MTTATDNPINRYFDCAICGRKFKTRLRTDGTRLQYCPLCRQSTPEDARSDGRRRLTTRPDHVYHRDRALRIVVDPDDSWSRDTYLTLGEIKRLAGEGSLTPGAVFKDTQTGAQYAVTPRGKIERQPAHEEVFA